MALVRFLFIVGVAVGLWLFYKHMGMDFVWGGLFVVFLYQFAHRAIHGTWIEF